MQRIDSLLLLGPGKNLSQSQPLKLVIWSCEFEIRFLLGVFSSCPSGYEWYCLPPSPQHQTAFIPLYGMHILLSAIFFWNGGSYLMWMNTYILFILPLFLITCLIYHLPRVKLFCSGWRNEENFTRKKGSLSLVIGNFLLKSGWVMMD